VRSSASSQAGFSLIELLVIVLLVGILAAIALPNFLGQDAKAHDADAKQAARTLQTTMRICGIEQDGSFIDPRACNLRRLREIEPSIERGGVSANPNSPTGGFTVRATSESGNSFTIVRGPDGAVERTCKVRQKDSPGGCSLNKGKKGSW
jgi:type IV pilus assembly protein PilA